jgi:hypothetical protein
MARPRHPNKEIEAAVRYAESRGWTFVRAGGHAWGILHCPAHARDGCQARVWSTPRDRTGHARDVRRAVERCPHTTGGQP